MIYKRVRRRRSGKNPWILWIIGCMIFISSIITVSVFFTSNYSIIDGQVYNSSSIRLGNLEVHNIPETPVDYIRDIEDASSQIRGEWLGLCDKGSIKTVTDFKNQVEKDGTLYSHFGNFQWDRAVLGYLKNPAKANVFHRKGDFILPSRKLITLPKGDGYITDGRRIVRTNCCNDVKPENEDDFQPYTPIPKAIPPVPVYVLEPHEDPIFVEPMASETFTSFTRWGGGGGGGGRRDDPPKPPDPPVPEPETWLLFGTGLMVLLGRKKFLTWFKK